MKSWFTEKTNINNKSSANIKGKDTNKIRDIIEMLQQIPLNSENNSDVS